MIAIESTTTMLNISVSSDDRFSLQYLLQFQSIRQAQTIHRFVADIKITLRTYEQGCRIAEVTNTK